MNKVFKRITATALTVIMLSLSVMSTAFATNETAEDSHLVEVYCPVNDDPEFPLNIELDFNEESIRYVDLEETVLGFEKMLDGDTLDFEMNVSLKDGFKSFDSYTLQILNADYSDEVVSKSANGGEVISVSGLDIGKGYKLNAMLKSDSAEADYAGQFTIQIEWNSMVVVDLFYQLAHLEGDGVAYAAVLNENDNRNNTISGGDNLLHGVTMVGTICSNDVDYFRYSSANKVSEDDPDEDDRTGVANLSFSLSLNSSAKICIEFFDENDNFVRKYETKDKTNTIFCRLANVPISEIYKIKITTDSSSVVEYELIPNYEFALAWYGQFVSKDDNGVYWNSNKLDTTYYYDPYDNNREYKMFDEGKSGKYDHVFTTACGVVSAAMIFRNLGATMEGYDFRTGYEGTLQADPFTAMLANCRFNGTELRNSNIWPDLPSDLKYPDELYRNEIGKKFGLNFVQINYITETSLRNAISQHDYVIVYFNNANASSNHFMVLTGLESGSNQFYNRATVYDPAARTYSTGVNVTLHQTTSGHRNDGINNILWAGYFV